MVPEDLIGSNLAGVVGTEEAEELLGYFASLTLKNPIYLNIHLETNNRGEQRWFRWTNRGIFDSNEQLQEIQAIGQDIHERKLAEKALQASETLYRSVVEDQLELICRALPDGTYTFTNHAYASFYGSTPDELIGRNVSEFLPRYHQKHRRRPRSANPAKPNETKEQSDYKRQRRNQMVHLDGSGNF